MKYITQNLLIVVLTSFSTLLFSQTSDVALTFDQEHVDLGEVKKGDVKTFQYTFTNTGKQSIEIEIVSGCDCTTLDWTHGDIPVGGTGVIDVIFDSTEKENSETVDIDIYLKNINPKSGSGYLIVLDYSFVLLR